MAHKIRCETVPGFKRKFDNEFTNRAKAGPVNVKDLTAEIFKGMGVTDPVRKKP